MRKTLIFTAIAILATTVLVAVLAHGRLHRQADPRLTKLASYKHDNGTYSVDIADVVLFDAGRKVDLPVTVYFPITNSGQFPVIVFSHGAGGSGNAYLPLIRYWASHGCVYIAPTHPDSVEEHREDGEQYNLLDAVQVAMKDKEARKNRPLDISFVIDSLAELENRVPMLKGKMDTSRLGVGGHSFGAFTAAAIGGATIDLPGHPGQSFRDKRVRAVLVLSGQGPGQMGLTLDSWDKCNGPMMSMTGSKDFGAKRQGPDWRKVPFERSPGTDKYHIFIDGASHMSFTGAAFSGELSLRLLAPRPSRDEKEIFDVVKSCSLAYWDAYLKNSDEAKRLLQIGGASEANNSRYEFI